MYFLRFLRFYFFVYPFNVSYAGENGSSGGWSYHSDRLLRAKAAFGVVNISDILEDPDCVRNK